MPKLKALKKDEDMEKIPVGEPILVELGPPPSSQEDDASGDDAKPVVKAKDETPDDDSAPEVKSLREQLSAMTAADKANKDALARAESEKNEALRIASERDRAAQTAVSERDQTERDLISSALQAAQGERDAGKVLFQQAFEAGDGAKMADAQSKISRAEGKILTFESSHAELSMRAEQAAKTPKVEPRQQPNLTPEQFVDQNQSLMPKEREWLKAHIEIVPSTERMTELGVAHNKAIRDGKTRGTDAYFDYIDEFMGFKQPTKPHDNDEGNNVMTAAPVSRSSPSANGGNTSNQVSLSPDARAMARSMGLTDREYALQVQNLDRAKREDPERYPSRR